MKPCPDRISSTSIRRLPIFFIVAVTFAACSTGQPPEPPKTSAAEHAPTTTETLQDGDADVTATIQQVISTSQHPSLRWNRIPDVVPVLQPLYANEPDHLFWFDRATPVESLKTTIAALTAAAEHGLDPADYDAAWLEEQFAALTGSGTSGADRALLDLGVSTAVVRILNAVHKGRVDPATMMPVSSLPSLFDMPGTVN